MRVHFHVLASILAPALLTLPAAADPARELIVVLAPATHDRAALQAAFETRLARMGFRLAGRLEDGLPPAAARDGDLDPFAIDPARLVLVEAPDAARASAMRAALTADPSVTWVEPNHEREPAVEWIGARPQAAPIPVGLEPGFPDDPLFRDSRQWGLRNLGPAATYGGLAGADVDALGAWAVTTGSNDLRLGVADTGIDPAHPDLAATLPDGGARVEAGFNSTSGPDHSVLDRYGHGTPVAGVIAARTHNGVQFDSLGAAGVCGGDGRANFGCRIVPIKIVREPHGNTTVWDIMRAIHYATRVGCRAMNLSFAGDAPSRVERGALHHAITHGCVVVTAIGNKGFLYGDAPQYPAAYAADGLCVAVGATDEFDQRALFSSYGPGLDVVAPGVDIWTTYMTYPSLAGVSYPGYVPAAGTSFAAPFVTGTIGLLAAARPDLLASDFQPLLRLGADDIGEPGVDVRTGWGRLDAAATLGLVGPAVGVWHDEVGATSIEALDVDTVYVNGDAPPAALAFLGWHRAARVEVRASIAIPDSFTGAVQVWPRAGGTSTLRARLGPIEFVPWCETTVVAGGRLSLRGYLYRILDAEVESPEDAWIPVPPDQARFGFTVMGPVRRAPAATGIPARPRVLAVPNPFRGATRLDGPAGARLAILDVAGRLVRRGAFDLAGGFAWDGKDTGGRAVAPGLYFARCDAPGGALTTRLVRME